MDVRSPVLVVAGGGFDDLAAQVAGLRLGHATGPLGVAARHRGAARLLGDVARLAVGPVQSRE